MKEITANMINYIIISFEKDKELQDIMYEYNLTNEEGRKEEFFYKVAETLYTTSLNNAILNSGLSAYDIYKIEHKKYEENILYKDYSSAFLKYIQQIISDLFPVLNYDWYNLKYRKLYVQILYSFFYASVNSFFFDNRKRFMPEYDWFLIEKEEERKLHIEAFFREFDKFSSIINSISNYTDISKIPQDYLAYLSAILGTKVILEEGINSHSKMRSLISDIVSVYKYKGTLYSLELFLASLGVGIKINELFFDRRLFWYDNTEEGNPFTKERNLSSYEYYLTPNNPLTTFYPLAPYEKARRLTEPKSFSYFKKLMDLYSVSDSPEQLEALMKKVLGYSEETFEEGTFTYFKTNTITLEFYFFYSEENLISLEYQKILERYMNMIIPIYIRKYYPTILFEGTSYTDAITFKLFNASEITDETVLADGTVLRYNLPNYQLVDEGVDEDGEKVDGDLFNLDGIEADSGENDYEYPQMRFEKIYIVAVASQNDDVFAIPFSYFRIEETSLDMFEEEGANVADTYAFYFNPEITGVDTSTVSAGNITIGNAEYANPIKKVYIINGDSEFSLDIS